MDAGEVEVAGLGARELARRGAGQGARRNQLDHRGQTGNRLDPLLDVVAEAGALVGMISKDTADRLRRDLKKAKEAASASEAEAERAVAALTAIVEFRAERSGQ